MDTDFCDDFETLDAATSERNFRSDADELDEYADEEELTEETDESEDDETSEDEVKLIPADDQILNLHSACLGFAPRFKTMKAQIEEMKDSIVTLRKRFNYKQGTSGNVIKFPADCLDKDGKPLGSVTWPEYCDRVFGLTTKRVGQILGAVDKSVKKEEKPDREKTLWRKGWKARNQQVANWIRAQQAAGTVFATDVPMPCDYADVVKTPVAKIVGESVDEELHFALDERAVETESDETSAIRYFARYKENPGEMVEIMRVILRTYGLDNKVSIETVEIGMHQAA